MAQPSAAAHRHWCDRVRTRTCSSHGWSSRTIRVVGAWRYASDPSTDVWCVGYAINDEPVQLWKPNDPDVHHWAISVAAADPDTVFIAHNANFERALFKHILGPRYGWPAIPLERWRCTMAAALALALPAKLAKITAALGLPAKADDDIMHRVTKPRAPRSGGM